MTIEQNLARYRELGKEITEGEWQLYEGRASDDLGIVASDGTPIAYTFMFREDAVFAASAPSILRDLETAVEVIKVLSGLVHELLSVETEDTICALWQKTHLERASDGDPLYRAELTKSELIEYKQRLKSALAAEKMGE